MAFIADEILLKSPTMNEGATNICLSDQLQVFIFLHVLDQSTIAKNPLHHRWKGREEDGFISCVIDNLSFLDKEFYDISSLELICITDDSRQAIIKTVSIKNPRKAFRQYSLDAIHFDDNRCMLPAGTQAEILTGCDKVAPGNHLRKSGFLILQDVL